MTKGSFGKVPLGQATKLNQDSERCNSHLDETFMSLLVAFGTTSRTHSFARKADLRC
jgi:hypothetical protein